MDTQPSPHVAQGKLPACVRKRIETTRNRNEHHVLKTETSRFLRASEVRANTRRDTHDQQRGEGHLFRLQPALLRRPRLTHALLRVRSFDEIRIIVVEICANLDEHSEQPENHSEGPVLVT